MLGKWLDLVVLKGFFSLNNSLILQKGSDSAELQTAL